LRWLEVYHGWSPIEYWQSIYRNLGVRALGFMERRRRG
jgi:hypothetical protein